MRSTISAYASNDPTAFQAVVDLALLSSESILLIWFSEQEAFSEASTLPFRLATGIFEQTREAPAWDQQFSNIKSSIESRRPFVLRFQRTGSVVNGLASAERLSARTTQHCDGKGIDGNRELPSCSRMSGPRPRSELFLTAREMQVVALMAEGLVNKEIAQHLDISIFTVKNHVHNILEKLGVSRRREAVRYAYERGLLKTAGPLDRLLWGRQATECEAGGDETASVAFRMGAHR